MISIHTSNGQPMTKLMILQQAVNVITSLEQQVRGKATPSNPLPVLQVVVTQIALHGLLACLTPELTEQL